MRWEKNTRLDRAWVIDKWIAPYLGDVRLRDLGRARIIEWRAAMLADGASPYRTNKALGTLSAALGSAVDNERLPANPCVGIKRMPHQRSRPRALSSIQVELIRDELPLWRDRTLVSLMGLRRPSTGGGARPSLARRARPHAEHRGDLHGGRTEAAHQDAPGTIGAGHRTAPGRPGRRQAARACPTPSSFRTATATRSTCATGVRGSGIRPHVTPGVKAVPYELRHTAASGLIYEGRPLPEIAAIMGHSIEMLLSNYTHLIEDARHAEGWSFEETITGRTGRGGHRSCARIVHAREPAGACVLAFSRG